MQDLEMTDQIAGLENEGPLNWWTEIQCTRSYVSIILLENADRKSTVSYIYTDQCKSTWLQNKARQWIPTPQKRYNSLQTSGTGKDSDS